MNERILNVKVGEPLEASLARTAQTMEALEKDEQSRIVAPFSEIVMDVRLPVGRAA